MYSDGWIPYQEQPTPLTKSKQSCVYMFTCLCLWFYFHVYPLTCRCCCLVSRFIVVALDGAFFGTSFAHLFFITFDRLVPDPARALYTPLIFGFKIHKWDRCHTGINGVVQDKICIMDRQHEFDGVLDLLSSADAPPSMRLRFTSETDEGHSQ